MAFIVPPCIVKPVAYSNILNDALAGDRGSTFSWNGHCDAPIETAHFLYYILKEIEGLAVTTTKTQFEHQHRNHNTGNRLGSDPQQQQHRNQPGIDAQNLISRVYNKMLGAFSGRRLEELQIFIYYGGVISPGPATKTLSTQTEESFEHVGEYRNGEYYKCRFNRSLPAESRSGPETPVGRMTTTLKQETPVTMSEMIHSSSPPNNDTKYYTDEYNITESASYNRSFNSTRYADDKKEKPQTIFLSESLPLSAHFVAWNICDSFQGKVCASLSSKYVKLGYPNIFIVAPERMHHQIKIQEESIIAAPGRIIGQGSSQQILHHPKPSILPRTDYYSCSTLPPQLPPIPQPLLPPVPQPLLQKQQKQEIRQSSSGVTTGVTTTSGMARRACTIQASSTNFKVQNRPTEILQSRVLTYTKSSRHATPRLYDSGNPRSMLVEHCVQRTNRCVQRTYDHSNANPRYQDRGCKHSKERYNKKREAHRCMLYKFGKRYSMNNALMLHEARERSLHDARNQRFYGNKPSHHGEEVNKCGRDSLNCRNSVNMWSKLEAEEDFLDEKRTQRSPADCSSRTEVSSHGERLMPERQSQIPERYPQLPERLPPLPQHRIEHRMDSIPRQRQSPASIEISQSPASIEPPQSPASIRESPQFHTSYSSSREQKGLSEHSEEHTGMEQDGPMITQYHNSYNPCLDSSFDSIVSFDTARLRNTELGFESPRESNCHTSRCESSYTASFYGEHHDHLHGEHHEYDHTAILEMENDRNLEIRHQTSLRSCMSEFTANFYPSHPTEGESYREKHHQEHSLYGGQNHEEDMKNGYNGVQEDDHARDDITNGYNLDVHTDEKKATRTDQNRFLAVELNPKSPISTVSSGNSHLSNDVTNESQANIDQDTKRVRFEWK